MQYSFLRTKSFTHSKTLQTSTDHNKLTIGTKTITFKKTKTNTQKKKIEIYCQQEHKFLKFKNSINSNNLLH